MMHYQCKCPHHLVARVFRVLSGLAALGFFVVVFRKATFLGWGADIYFMSAIMLVVMALATKSCGCCRRHGMGCGCGVCMPGEMKEKMEKMEM